VRVVAGSFATVEALCSLVAGDHGNGHDPGAPLGHATAGCVQQFPAGTGAAGAAGDHERFQGVDLVSPLPRPGGASGPDHGIAEQAVCVTRDQHRSPGDGQPLDVLGAANAPGIGGVTRDAKRCQVRRGGQVMIQQFPPQAFEPVDVGRSATGPGSSPARSMRCWPMPASRP
jgi:hypothetical protein